MLDQLNGLQQQVVDACAQVTRTEKQAHQLIEGVHSANQSAQQCISEIHQVKQQALDLFQQGEQLLIQSKQHQHAFECLCVLQIQLLHSQQQNQVSYSEIIFGIKQHGEYF